MSREDWEVFDLIREENKQKRNDRADRANEELPRLRELAESAGLHLVVHTYYHWQVRDSDGRVLVDYWPSTKKQQNRGSRRARTQVSLSDFEYKLRLLCDQS